MINMIIRKITQGRDLQLARERERIGSLTGFMGILMNFFLFAVKGLLGMATGSISLIADAFNNLTDTASSVITIIGFKMAGKEPDQEHPYGHGRIEYLTGLTISILVIVVGYQFVVSSIDRIKNPAKVTVTTVALVIIFLSISVKIFIHLLNKRLGEKIMSGTLLATAQDALGDILTTSVVLLGLFVSRLTTFPVDGFVGVAIALYIIYSGIRLSLETIGPLLGEKPEDDLANAIKEKILSYPLITGVHDLHIHSYGPSTTMATIDAEIPYDLTLVEAHNLVDRIERHVREDLGIQLVIHMDPFNDKDERYLEVKRIVGEMVEEMDHVLSFHDFRYTGRSEKELLILEIVVDSKHTTENEREEIRKTLEAKLKDRFRTAKILITVDLDVAIL